jgi:hypothetical protein
MKIIYAIALAALAGALPSAAQAPEVGPGSAEIRTDSLRDHVDTLEVMLSRGEEAVSMGTLVLRTTRTDSATLLRVERVTVSGGMVMGVDSFTVDRRTLAPIAVHTVERDRTRELRFVEGRVRASGGGAPVETRLAAPAFYGNSTDLVLAALPLRAGYEARVRFFDHGDEGAATARLRVTGSEDVVTRDGGRCAAWRVEVEGGSHTGTYWIAAGDRSLVRYDGESGLRILRRTGCGGAAPGARVARR